MFPSPFARRFGIKSASFANEQYRNQGNKAIGKPDCYQKVIICPSEPCRLIFDYATIEELDEAVLNRLISRILIGEVKKVDGQKVQEVRIVYNFVGEIPEIAAQKLKSPPMPEGFLALSIKLLTSISYRMQAFHYLEK